MITGNNTDVDYGGRRYHVQTEDRGDEKPIVESLIYCQGEILGTRRTEYEEGLDGSSVAALLERQHGRLIREIRNGLWAPEGPRLVGEELLSDRGFEEVVAEFLAESPDMERVHLAADAHPALRVGVSSRVRVRALQEGDEARPATATIVTVRRVAAGLPPSSVAEGETDETGWFEFSVVPRAEGSDPGALIVTSGATGGGQLRLPIRQGRKG